MFKFIVYKEEGRLAEIRLNKPPYNVLDIPMMEEINLALDNVMEKEANLNVLAITAEGEKAFSAGVDVADHTADKVDKMIDVFHGIFRRLERLNLVTVAAVKGAALGGGCELALGCDLIIAAENAKFGQPEIKLAVYPPIAITYLSSIVGIKKAFEIVMMGENFSADEAKTMGLVNNVMPLEGFDSAFSNFVKKFETLSGSALKVTKKAFKRASNFNFNDTLKEVEKIYLKELMVLSDANEGLNSFLEKRKPAWTHK